MTLAKKTQELPPAILAVANVHRDYADICVEGCCTGSRFPLKFPEGTITFLRQTAGGQGKRSYGVVGVWYYAGDSRRVAGADLKWPRKWSWRIGFEPLIRRLERTFCEEFSGPAVEGGAPNHKSSLYVPEMSYTNLQGTIVSVHPHLGAPYVRAFMKERKAELDVSAAYMGREVNIYRLLGQLADALEERAREKAARVS